MEKTDLIIEPITSSEMYNEIIAEAGGWEAFCKEREVEIAPEGEEWLRDFIKDGVAYRLGGQQWKICYDHDWFYNQFFE